MNCEHLTFKATRSGAGADDDLGGATLNGRGFFFELLIGGQLLQDGLGGGKCRLVTRDTMGHSADGMRARGRLALGDFINGNHRD